MIPLGDCSRVARTPPPEITITKPAGQPATSATSVPALDPQDAGTTATTSAAGTSSSWIARLAWIRRALRPAGSGRISRIIRPSVPSHMAPTALYLGLSPLRGYVHV